MEFDGGRMNKMCLPVEDRIFSIGKQYHNVISPLVNELEVMDEEYPIEIFNELRAVMTHVSRYRIKNNENIIIVLPFNSGFTKER